MDRNDIKSLEESYQKVRENEELLEEKILRHIPIDPEEQKRKIAMRKGIYQMPISPKPSSVPSKPTTPPKSAKPSASFASSFAQTLPKHEEDKKPLTIKQRKEMSKKRQDMVNEWLQKFNDNLNYYYFKKEEKMDDWYNRVERMVTKNKERLIKLGGIHLSSLPKINTAFDDFFEGLKNMRNASEKQLEKEQSDHITKFYNTLIEALGEIVNIPAGYGFWKPDKAKLLKRAEALKASKQRRPDEVTVLGPSRGF